MVFSKLFISFMVHKLFSLHFNFSEKMYMGVGRFSYQVVVDGIPFRKERSFENMVIWKCRVYKCPCKLETRGDRVMVYGTHEHCDEPDEVDVTDYIWKPKNVVIRRRRNAPSRYSTPWLFKQSSGDRSNQCFWKQRFSNKN